MRKKKFYNSKVHKGNFPVRVLNYNYVEKFKNINSDFKEELSYEVISHGFNDKIKINLGRNQITNIAYINEKGINLFENFNQYLWSISYSLIYIFDIAIQTPSIKGKFDGKILINTSNLRKAKKLFDHSFSLLEDFNTQAFFALPNPETYTKSNSYYIERANTAFSNAMVFILLHEFGHQYYGHLMYESNNNQAKKEEFDVDDYSFDHISKNFNSNEGKGYKLGIVIGLGSLLFLDKNLKGGDKHPDIDDRLVRQIEKMDLDPIDNIWGIACLMIYLWSIRFSINLKQQQSHLNYKEMFYFYSKQLQELKTTNTSL